MSRETSLSAGSELGVVLFDEPSQMTLRAVKLGTEQKKILKYANAKKEVSGRERKEVGSLYRRESGSEMEAALSATSSCHLFSSLLALATLLLSILGASRRSARGRVKPPQDMKSRTLDVEQLGWW